MKKTIKVVLINLIFIIFIILVSELLFGHWFEKNYFGYNMKGKRLQKIDFVINKKNIKKKWTYRRDYYGFREEFDFKNKYDLSKIEIVFTGGSTGSEMIMPYEETIVGNLNKYLNTANLNTKIFNASLDGKSLIGKINESINIHMIESTQENIRPHGTAETGFGSPENICLRFWLVFMYRYIGLKEPESEREADKDKIMRVIEDAMGIVRELDRIQYNIVSKREFGKIRAVHRWVSEIHSPLAAVHARAPVQGVGDEDIKRLHSDVRIKEHELSERLAIQRPSEGFRKHSEQILAENMIEVPRDDRSFDIGRCIKDAEVRILNQSTQLNAALAVLGHSIKLSICLSLPKYDVSNHQIVGSRQRVGFEYFPKDDTAKGVAEELLTTWCNNHEISLSEEMYDHYIRDLEKGIGDRIDMFRLQQLKHKK